MILVTSRKTRKITQWKVGETVHDLKIGGGGWSDPHISNLYSWPSPAWTVVNGWGAWGLRKGSNSPLNLWDLARSAKRLFYWNKRLIYLSKKKLIELNTLTYRTLTFASSWNCIDSLLDEQMQSSTRYYFINYINCLSLIFQVFFIYLLQFDDFFL